MKRKYIPAFVMLLAGAVVSIAEIVMQMDVLKSLEILLVVLVVFYILGCIAKAIVVKVLDEGKDNEDGEMPEDEGMAGLEAPLEPGQEEMEEGAAGETVSAESEEG